MKKVTIELFEFNELNEEAKQNAIEYFRDREMSYYNSNDEYYQCFDNYEDFVSSLDDEYIT